MVQMNIYDWYIVIYFSLIRTRDPNNGGQIMNLHNSSRVASPTIKSRCNELFACDVSNSYVLFSVMGIAHSIRSHCQSGCWLPGPCKCVATGKLRPRHAVSASILSRKGYDPSRCTKDLAFSSFLNTANIFYFIPRKKFPRKKKWDGKRANLSGFLSS